MKRGRCPAVALAGVPPGAAAEATVQRIGYLSTRASRSVIDDAFLTGMRGPGFVEGRNLAIEYRWAENDRTRLRPQADELVRAEVVR